MEHGFILQNHKDALLKVKFAVNQPHPNTAGILTGEATLPNTAGYTYRGSNSMYR